MTFTIKKTKLIFLLSSLTLSLIVGYRGATLDTQVYYDVFKNIENFNLFNPLQFYILTGMEIGFGWYSFFINLFSNSSVVLFALFSFLTFYFIYEIAKEVSPSYVFTSLLYLSSGYFLIQQFMQIRQGLAIPIALYAIILLIKKKNKVSLPFVLYALIAVSLHQVAIPLLLVGFLLCFFRFEERVSLHRFKILSLIIAICIIVISNVFLKNLLINVSSRVSDYAQSSYAEEVGVFRLPNIKAIATFVFMLIMMDEKAFKNKFYTVFYIFFVLGVAFRLGFYDFAILSGRFATAFTFSEIFILPFAFYRFGFYGKIGIILFVLLQTVATYVYQSPYVLEDYFNPLIL